MEKIQDYGIIGNGRSAALVSRKGSIDWLCWPRFDSPSLFAKILDSQIGGFWQISPITAFKTHRHYIPHSNVLETHFSTDTGKVVLTDFMTALSEEQKAKELHPEHELIRVLSCQEGELSMKIHFKPALNYARKKTKIYDLKHFGLRIGKGKELLTLKASIKFDSIGDDGASTVVHLKSGARLFFSLTFSTEGPACISSIDESLISHKLQSTLSWWQNWAHRAKYDGPYKEMVIRSALALKLLGYAPSGAFVAAATTSLPERIGGDLNWDYRFCWLRDAAFTVRPLLALGYIEEADAFINWMLHTTRLTLPKLKVFYDVYGKASKNETIIPLSGYENSKPVRIGNGSRDQIQLDVYGTVMEGVHYYVQSGGRLDREMQKVLKKIGNYVSKNWQMKESGIWEERSQLDHYTYSRLMCWVTLDKLLDMKDKCYLSQKESKKFEEERDLIRKEIEKKGWNSEINAYTSVLNGKQLDACQLLMPFYGFEDASSKRMQQTYAQINNRLSAGNGLVYRYEKSLTQEGAFLICSFWKVDFMARAGEIEKARHFFKEAIQHANDLGLFAEEQDPLTGEALGNFPQAFTHLGLINAALLL